MKRISYFIIFLAMAITSCGSSPMETSTAYTDPGFDSIEKVANTKEATFSSMSAQNSSGESCDAIIFDKEIDGTDYIGIGYKKDTFYIKIYWEANSIPETIDTTNFKINIKGSTSTTDNLKLTIDYQGDGTYLITFKEDITVTGSGSGSYTIKTGDTIRAAKY